MCEVTADGDIIIGRIRPKNNPLIHRPVVGKPSFHNDMPPLPDDYTFGAPLKRDAEGAGEVMLSWHNPRPNGNPLVQQARARRRFVADPDRVYGAPSGDICNMADLMQNKYELEWVNEQKARHEAQLQALEKERQRKKAPTRIALERDERMKRQVSTAVRPHPKEYFTMKQFKQVPSRYAAAQPTVGSPDYYSPATHRIIDCDQHGADGGDLYAGEEPVHTE